MNKMYFSTLEMKSYCQTVLKVFRQFNLQYDLLYLEEYTTKKSFHILEWQSH